MDIRISVHPRQEQPAGAVMPRHVVELKFERSAPQDGNDVAELIQQTMRVELDPQLSAVAVLTDAATPLVQANLLGMDGALRLGRRLVADEAGSAEFILEPADVAALKDTGQQLPGSPAPRMVERTVRLLNLGTAALDFSRAQVLVAVVPDVAAWQGAGLSAIFGGEAGKAMAIDVGGMDLGAAAVLEWRAAHLAVDGTVTATLEQRKSAGLLLLLTGTANVLGFVPDDLASADSRSFSLAIPDAGAVLPLIPPGDAGHPHGQRVPADVTETELANNPDIFGEDPGSFCRPFTNPERVLSERSFFTIARVTQPDIGPLTSAKSRTIKLLDPDGDSAAAGAGTAAATGTGAAGGGLFGLFRGPAPAVPARAPLRLAPAVPSRHLIAASYANLLKRLPQGRTTVDTSHPVQWEDDIAQYQACSVALGHILEFRMRWRSNGYSLGTVASTLTLAPRQTKRIQKVEWARRERARRAEVTQQTDRVADSTTRERDFQDSVAANLSEWSFGASHSDVAAVAGGIGFFAEAVLGGVGGGAGMSNSTSYQESGRSTTASEQQRLRDAIRRHGDSLRRLESTVVNEVEQEENVTGTTEVLRNANYAHSLTVIYYQILRHLKVSTEFAGVRECLFIPFAIKPFDLQRAYRWREAIRKSIRDRRFGRALEFLKDVNEDFAFSDVPAGSRAQQAIKALRGSIYLSIGIERPRDKADGGFDPDTWAIAAPMLGVPAYGIFAGLNAVSDRQRDRQYQAEYAPGIATNWANRLQLSIGNNNLHADCTLATRYQFNGKVRIDFTIPEEEVAGLTRAALTRLDVRPRDDLPPGSIANLTGLSITYNTDRYERTVRARTGINDLVTPAGARESAAVALPLDGWEVVDERAEMRRSVAELLEHLNEHVEYYHKAVWWRMDRDRLLMLLDGFYVPGSNNVSIASVVDREPLGIIGNSLVYRVGAASFVGLGKITTPSGLYDIYAPREPATDPMFISLPTEGLYAQAIMDECPALEEHFGNTDWVLQDKEPDLGQIAPELLQSRRADVTTGSLPSAMPATIINLQNAPEAPAPAGLAGVLAAVTKGDSFRDAAGLAGTQANARAAFETAAGLATTFGQGAASLASAELASKIHATNTADQKLSSIKRAEDMNLIDRPEAAAQSAEVLREMHTPRQSSKPHQEQPIIAAIDSARGIGGSVIEASTTEGNVRVAVGGDRAAAPKPGQSALVGLLKTTVEKTADALAKGLGNARANPDGKLGEALRAALLEAAKKELAQQGIAAVEKLPVGKALVLGVKLALAFAAGVGSELEKVNQELRARYDDLVSKTASDGDGLTEEQIEMLGSLRSFQLTAVQHLPRIVQVGLENVALTARDLLVEQAGKAFKDSILGITTQVAGDDEVIGLIASAVQKGQVEIPEERRKVEEYLLKLVVNGFVRQLDDGRLKTALDTTIKAVKGNNPIIVELLGGVIFALLQVETQEIQTQLGGAFPEVKALLTRKAVELKAVYDADGNLQIVTSGNEVKTEAGKITAPAAAIAQIDAAAGNPSPEVFELLALADRFVTLKEVEGARLRAAIFRLQRRVTGDSAAFARLESDADFENTLSMRRIATGFTNVVARVQELLSLPDAVQAERFLVDRTGPLNSIGDVTDTARFFRLDDAGAAAAPFERTFSARAFVSMRNSQGVDL